MKLNSLIDNIRDSIVTGLGKKVRVSDKSLLNVLISDIDEDTPSDSPTDKKQDFRQRLREICRHYLTPNPEYRFPVSRLLVQAVLLLTLVPLFLLYCLIALIGALFGKKVTLRGVIHSPRTNMIISVGIIVGAITVLVSMLVFFINDVMLYSPRRDINSKGALTITQPCHREHSIFMFNSATLWADTGIDLVPGDVVTISGSGSFNSSIWDKNVTAAENSKPTYPLVNIAYDMQAGSSDSSAAKDCIYCIFNDHSLADNPPRFGSLLYQIQPSQRKCLASHSLKGKISQARVNPASGALNERFTVKEPGTLFVCVNDIYLTPEIVTSMFEQNSDSLWSIRPEAASTLKLYLPDSLTTDTVSDGPISQLRQRLLALTSTPDGRAHWLHDNCGDVLLSISVERNIWSATTVGSADKIYSYMFRGLERVIFPSPSTLRILLILGGCLLGWLILDWAIGRALRHSRRKE